VIGECRDGPSGFMFAAGCNMQGVAESFGIG
jgi:hypothetical protein